MINVAGNQIDLHLEEGDIVTDVIVLAIVQKPTDEEPTLCIGLTESTNYYTHLGMMRAAQNILECGDDDED